MSECDCDYCNRHKRIKDIINDRDFDKLVEEYYDLDNEAAHLELDCEVYKKIFDGTWPDSVMRLEHAIKNIRLRRKNHE